MINLTRDYVASQLKLSDTDTIVIVNGSYQPQLSIINNLLSSLVLTEQTLVLSQNSKTLSPLHLLFITLDSYQGEFNVVAEKSSLATLIEEHLSLGENSKSALVNLNLNIKESSQINHYKLQAGGVVNQLEYQTSTRIDLGENSKFTSSFINQGMGRSINRLQVKFSGSGASYDYQGIDLLQDQQTMEHQIIIDHLFPNCSSNILSKSIIDNQASCSFGCKAIAHPGAFQTTTHVANKNLLLSEFATANSQPELEVYVDEVVCTHGATSGQLDSDALFYLRSRGLSEKRAIKFLTYAFVQEIAVRFPQYARFKITDELTTE